MRGRREAACARVTGLSIARKALPGLAKRAIAKVRVESGRTKEKARNTVAG